MKFTNSKVWIVVVALLSLGDLFWILEIAWNVFPYYGHNGSQRYYIILSHPITINKIILFIHINSSKQTAMYSFLVIKKKLLANVPYKVSKVIT